MKACRFLFLLTTGTIAVTSSAQVAVVSSYTQNFDSIGTALPAGWGVWLSSTSSGNGTAFAWNTAQVANNATANDTNYFRNLPGASQTWSAGLASGSDRAIGWRAGSAASTDGSITFTFANTSGWNFQSMSFQLFTPNSTGTAATFQFQYQIGSSGTFTNFSPTLSYTTNTAANPLTVTTISLNADQLATISGQSSQVTLRLENAATSGTAWQSLSLDNFSYSASAVPEPSTYAALAGATALIGAVWHRRRRRAAAGETGTGPAQ